MSSPSRFLPMAKSSKLLSLPYFLLLLFSSFCVSGVAATQDDGTIAKRITTASTPLLSSVLASATGDFVDIQVYPPVLTPFSTFADSNQGILAKSDATTKLCSSQEVLMVHSFANSYYVPFVGLYTPPSCSFNRVTFNMTTVVDGVQFDRLGSVYLGSNEIWRTTTGEPAGDPPTTYTYIKDMSAYLALLKTNQTLIMELNNVVDSTYTGIYNITITATFFTTQDIIDPADQIISVNKNLGSQDQASIWQVPGDTPSQLITIPRNTNKAVFVMSATGQIDEEFWYTNYLSSETETFGTPAGNGYSPFREIQLYVDSKLAGVVLPYPVIFSGGINPELWRPILGIDAFDLRMDQIDVTPWLPLLCDGNAHNFTLAVAGINDNGNLKRLKGTVTPGVGSFWLLSGNIFIWTDPAGDITTGTMNVSGYTAPEPKVTLSSSILTDPTGMNDSLSYNVAVKRSISITSTVKTAAGSAEKVWTQSLSYAYQSAINADGLVQSLSQNSTGTDQSLSGGKSVYMRQIDYPLFLNFTLAAVYIKRTQIIGISGVPVLPSGLQPFDSTSGNPLYQTSHLSTTQNAFQIGVGGVESTGETSQSMSFTGMQTGSDKEKPHEDYYRSVDAINGMFVKDVQTLGTSTVSKSASGTVPTAFPALDQLLLGRSPLRKAD